MENLIINKIYITKELGDVNKFLIPCINTRCELNVYKGCYIWLKIEYLFSNEMHMIKIPYIAGCNIDLIAFANTVIKLTYETYNELSSNEEIYARDYMCDKCDSKQKLFSIFTIAAVIVSSYSYMREDELMIIVGKAVKSCVVGVEYPTKEQIRKYF